MRGTERFPHFADEQPKKSFKNKEKKMNIAAIPEEMTTEELVDYTAKILALKCVEIHPSNIRMVQNQCEHCVAEIVWRMISGQGKRNAPDYWEMMMRWPV